MEIYGLQKLTLLDFPGKTACIVFTGGCNFRCPYCYNPTLVFRKEDVINEADFFTFLEKRKGLLDGVSISGGEPTLQNGLCDFVTKVKAMGFAVKLDTNGTNPDVLSMLYKEQLLDYVAMDVKSSFASYHTVAGTTVDINAIMRSINIIMQSNVPYEFRTTLISEYHDEQAVSDISEAISGAKQYFLQAFRDTGALVGSSHLTPVPLEKAEDFRRILCKRIHNVTLRGY